MKTRSLALALPIVLSACLITLSGWQPGPSGKDPQDTTKKSKKKNAGYSKKTIITFDENGNPHEQTFEEFEGDEGLRKLIVPGRDFDMDRLDFEDFEMPELPELQFGIPELNLDALSELRLDALSGLDIELNDGKFEGFGDEMEALMKERFEAMRPQFEEGMQLMEDQLRNMDLSLNHQFEGINKNLEAQMQSLERNMGSLDVDLRGLDENLQNLDIDLKYMNESIQAFSEAAQEELIQDGYLKPGDKVESIAWTDDSIKFNGKKIKPEHLKKYRELKDKHVKKQWYRGKPE